jgi:hypothetical protein
VNEIRIERAVEALCEAIEAEPDREDPEVCRTLRELDAVLDEGERLIVRQLH